LHVITGPATTRLDQVAVRVGRLRILVEVLHVRVRRSRVEVEVVLLHVLAMVSLAVRESEQPLLEDGILAVPEGQGETEELPIVGDAGETILSPAIRPSARLVVAEVVPRVTIVAVVLADRSP